MAASADWDQRSWALGAWGVGLVAVALVVYFDFQTSLPLHDEFARRFTIQEFAAGRGFKLWGTSSNLVQTLVAWPLAKANLDARFWRLTLLPFLALNAVFSWAIARRLGADSFWASVAGVVLLAAPLTLNLATGIMTEIPFLGVFMGALYFGLLWLDEARLRWIALTALFAFLAGLQRPQAIGIAMGMAGGLFIWRRQRLSLIDLVGLALLAVAVIAPIEIDHFIRGVAQNATFGIGKPSDVLGEQMRTIVYTPIMLGVLLLPLAVGLASRPVGEQRGRNRWDLLPLVIGDVGIAAAIAFLLTPLTAARSIFPGSVMSQEGLGWDSGLSGKPDLFPFWLLLLLEALTIASIAVLLVWRRRIWLPPRLNRAQGLLVIFAVIQLAFIVAYGQVLDRYFVIVVAPLVPFLASAAGMHPLRPRLVRALALGTLAAGLLVYVAGEQDYIAWQVARDRAAQLAYTMAAPADVQAGFEETAEHIWIPAAESPAGTRPIAVSDHPVLQLEFAPVKDSRPGFAYSSLSPAKIIVVRASPSPTP